MGNDNGESIIQIKWHYNNLATYLHINLATRFQEICACAFIMHYHDDAMILIDMCDDNGKTMRLLREHLQYKIYVINGANYNIRLILASVYMSKRILPISTNQYTKNTVKNTNPYHTNLLNTE